MEGKNVLASITGNVPVIEEGEKGAKGATERPRSWDEIPDGSAIESGTGNEQWIEQGNVPFFLAVQSHLVGRQTEHRTKKHRL